MYCVRVIVRPNTARTFSSLHRIARKSGATRVRNVTTLAAVACVELMSPAPVSTAPDIFLARVRQFIADDRLLFWGEGAFSQHSLIIWFLEKRGAHGLAKEFLLRLTTLVARRSHENSTDSLPDGYTSPDDCLTQMLSDTPDTDTKKIIESHSLLPFIILCVRRQMRSELGAIWVDITHARISILRTEDPLDVLQWSADDASENSHHFKEHSWRELTEFAFRQDADRLVSIFQKDTDFALMYLLTFQHRMMASLIKHLDEHVLPRVIHATRD